MKVLFLATVVRLLLTIVVGFFFAPGEICAQGQYFLDETALRLPARNDGPGDGAFGNLDGDGDLDIVVATSSVPPYRAYYLLNDGFGVFPDESLHNLFSMVYNFSSVSIGDVERDGDYDLLFSAYSDKIKLLLRMEDGSYVDVSETRLPGHTGAHARDDALIDVDNDLFLDISIVQYGWDWLWINDGRGYFDFFPEERFPSGLYNSNAVAWGDVDGDFDPDCVIANNTGHPNLLMINDGTGWFSDETAGRLPEDLEQSNGVALADLDGDGDLDVVIVNGFFPGKNKIWINDGAGYFADETDLRLQENGNASSGVAVGDIDNDNDMDLLIANKASGGDANKVLVNDGEGYFTDETWERYPPLEDESTEIKLGDVDNDGDLDCYVLNVGEAQYGEQNRLLINQSTPDSFPPTIPGTYRHPDTGDTTNPYLVTTTVWDNISVVIGELKVSLLYRALDDTVGEAGNAAFLEVPMLDCGGFLHRERIPAQSSWTMVEYYIEAEDRRGNVSYDPPDAPDSLFRFLVDVSVGIRDDGGSPSLPRSFSLAQNYPNPFNPSTTIEYAIPEGERVRARVKIFDIRGKLTRTLIDTESGSGHYSAHWDGRDQKGNVVGSGIYLYQIEAGEFTSLKKMMLTR